MLQKRAAALAKSVEARVTIIDGDGTVLADSHANPAEMDNHANRPEVRIAMRDGTGVVERFSATVRRNVLYAAARIPGGKLRRDMGRLDGEILRDIGLDRSAA